MRCKLNERELATVLYALREVQRKGIDPAAMHFNDLEEGNGPLDADEIDDLCERLNCGE